MSVIDSKFCQTLCFAIKPSPSTQNLPKYIFVFTLVTSNVNKMWHHIWSKMTSQKGTLNPPDQKSTQNKVNQPTYKYFDQILQYELLRQTLPRLLVILPVVKFPCHFDLV